MADWSVEKERVVEAARRWAGVQAPREPHNLPISQELADAARALEASERPQRIVPMEEGGWHKDTKTGATLFIDKTLADLLNELLERAK